jgi:hypothetical protein
MIALTRSDYSATNQVDASSSRETYSSQASRFNYDFRSDQGANPGSSVDEFSSWEIGNTFSTDIGAEINSVPRRLHIPNVSGNATVGSGSSEASAPVMNGGTPPAIGPTMIVTPSPGKPPNYFLPIRFDVNGPTSSTSPSSASDPYTLYTYCDSYTPDGGLDRQTFMARYKTYAQSPARDTGGSATLAAPNGQTGTPDPGLPGSFAVTTQEYTFGDTAFHPSNFPGPGVELTAQVKAPTDLPDKPLPLIILLHGRHATAYDPATNTPLLEWPPAGSHLTIPSYRGYEYLGDVLASQGYVVASISANGINAQDNGVMDLGAQARAELIQRQLDIWNDLSSGDGTVQPFGVAPFGTGFVGHVDLQNVGLMGHSRGGEGVVKSYLYNQSLGAPYGIKAVFALAPVDFNRPVDNNVPLAVLLPYNDGDVSDLQGVHFFDDARYNVSGDTGDKYTILVHGANHNFYNTIWTPGMFPAGTLDDGLAGPPARLTSAQERGTGLVSMAAFFRSYIGGETQFLPILRGDVAPPPTAQVTDSQIYFAYQRADDGHRLDVNRLLDPASLVTNTLGGAASGTGLVNYRVYGDTSTGETAYIFGPAGEPGTRFPHTVPSARSSRSGLSQLEVSYNAPGAHYSNQIPKGYNDVSSYYALQFRAGVAFGDPLNPAGQAQDFSVGLSDAEGDYASIPVSQFSNALYYPPGGPIHQILNTVRIPLTAYAYYGIDLTHVQAIQFDFDQRTSGSYLLDDLAFTDPSNLYAGPYVKSSSPGGIVTFNAPIDPTSFTTKEVSITGPTGEKIPVNSITADPASPSTRFTISFSATIGGDYTATIGPNITDFNGTPMDQNFNGVPGEPSDTAVATFTVAAPQITAFARNGDPRDPASSVRVTFNEPINPDTFTPAQVTSFTDPHGMDVPVTDVQPVGSSNTQFDVIFPEQTVFGTYHMTVGPDIYDVFGIRMAAPFMGQFPINSDLIINGGFETGNFMGWTQSGNTGATGVSTATVHSGMYSAYLGPVGSEGFLAEIFPTNPGASYILDYWLQHDGGTPSTFHAMIDGVNIPGSVLNNPNPFPYTEYTFTFAATGSRTELKFGFREDPTYFHLDDVSVNPA